MKINKWKSLCKAFGYKNFSRLSESTGVPSHSFYRYSQGLQNPSYEVLYKLFRFGCSVAYLCNVKIKIQTEKTIIPKEEVPNRVKEIFELAAKEFNLMYFELAQKIKISESALSRYRSGERFPGLETLINCKKNGINPDAFFSLEVDIFLKDKKKSEN